MQFVLCIKNFHFTCVYLSAEPVENAIGCSCNDDCCRCCFFFYFILCAKIVDSQSKLLYFFVVFFVLFCLFLCSCSAFVSHSRCIVLIFTSIFIQIQMSLHCLYLLKNFTSIDFTRIASFKYCIAPWLHTKIYAMENKMKKKQQHTSKRKRDMCNQKVIDNGADK